MAFRLLLRGAIKSYAKFGHGKAPKTPYFLRATMGSPCTGDLQMSARYSFQTSQDFRPGTAELYAMESKLASLQAVQRDLLQQLKAAQSHANEVSAVSYLRTNIAQVNSHIETMSLE